MADRRKAVIVAAGGALVIAAIGAVALDRRETSGSSAPLLSVLSRPAGAEVRIAGTNVGQTPYYGDNRYGTGPVQVRLSLRGFLDWSGQFDGGEQTTVDVTLVRPQPKISVDRVEVRPGSPSPPPDAPTPEDRDWSDPDLASEAKAAHLH